MSYVEIEPTRSHKERKQMTQFARVMAFGGACEKNRGSCHDLVNRKYFIFIKKIHKVQRNYLKLR